MIYGVKPYKAIRSLDLSTSLQQGFRSESYFTEESAGSAEVKDLITKLLVIDPSARLTASQVLEHPWLLGETDLSNSPALIDVQDNLQKVLHVSKFINETIRTLIKQKLSSEDLMELRK